MTTVTRALNSVGKKCFVDYYNDFKVCSDKNALAQKLFAQNSSASSLSAQITRINYAQWIFQNSCEKEALEIILSSRRLDAETMMKARQIYRSL